MLNWENSNPGCIWKFSINYSFPILCTYYDLVILQEKIILFIAIHFDFSYYYCRLIDVLVYKLQEHWSRKSRSVSAHCLSSNRFANCYIPCKTKQCNQNQPFGVNRLALVTPGRHLACLSLIYFWLFVAFYEGDL